ncbi:MAG TPA: hypothetical protein PLR99_32445 [Polyangiaceae bacterium]|nr:hypothetical protein [Polyangiaceae bacterium]
MLIPVAAAVVALACFAASARRLWFALTATAHDLDRVVEALRGDAGARRAGRIVQTMRGEASWEAEVLAAFESRDAVRRTADLNEQMTELDHRLARWSRVPRVCASLSSSVGFLLAALLMRRGLADPASLAGDVQDLVTTGLVGQALTVVGFGLAGAVGCAALHARGRRAAKDGSLAADAFVARLEALADRGLLGVAHAAGGSDEKFSPHDIRPVE